MLMLLLYLVMQTLLVGMQLQPVEVESSGLGMHSQPIGECQSQLGMQTLMAVAWWPVEWLHRPRSADPA